MCTELGELRIYLKNLLGILGPVGMQKKYYKLIYCGVIAVVTSLKEKRVDLLMT
jgi:hypothetical protein